MGKVLFSVCLYLVTKLFISLYSKIVHIYIIKHLIIPFIRILQIFGIKMHFECLNTVINALFTFLC